MTRFAKTAEKKNAEISMYSKQLEEGLAKFRETDGYKALLDSMSQFHTYSFRNMAMIALQMPGAARVAGFNAWKKLGRYVKKGEKGLRIFAPIVRKTKSEDEDSQEEKHVAGYRLVSVFDVSQTEGKPLPDENIFDGEALAETVDGFAAIRKAIESVAAFPVEVGKVGIDDARGVCMFDEKRIVVSDKLTGAGFIRTLAHETAHSLLHGPGCPGTRNDHEIEAESVTYIVCRRLGIDTSGKSFAYIASWAGSMSDDEFRARLVSIQEAASRIIDAVDKALHPEDDNAAA